MKLSEMSLRGYGVDSGGNGLTSHDIATGTKRSFINSLENKLSKSGYEWNLLLVPSGNDEEGRLQNLLHSKNISMDGAITFVVRDSGGHSITPWMLVHRAAHAVFESDNVISSNRQLFDDMWTMMGEFAARFNDDDEHGPWDVWCKLLHFRSAIKMTASSPGVGELIHDMTAAYIFNNGLVIKPNNNWNYGAMDQPTQRSLFELKSKLVRCIKAALDNCVGKTLISADLNKSF